MFALGSFRFEPCFYIHVQSGSLPVPPSHAPSAHNLPSLRALNDDTTRKMDEFPSFPLKKTVDLGVERTQFPLCPAFVGAAAAALSQQ